MRNLVFACAACSLLLWIAGCGGSAFEDVTGTVKFSDGTPLTTGVVVFHSDQATPRGQIKGDGSFTLYNGEDPGAPAGSYKVSIAASVETSGGDQGAAAPKEEGGVEEAQQYGQYQSLIDAKYASPQSSGLTAEVKAGKNQFAFTVEKPAEGGLPSE